MKTYAVLEIVVDINGQRKWADKYEVEAENPTEAITTISRRGGQLRRPTEVGDMVMISATEVNSFFDDDQQTSDTREAKRFFQIEYKLMHGLPLTPEEAAEVEAAGIMNEENIPVEQRERIRLTTDPPDQE